MLNKKSRNLLKASFIGTFAEGMFIPVYALFIDKVGGSIIDVGIAYAVFSIVKGIIIFILGRTRFFKNHIHEMVVLGFALAMINDIFLIFVTNQYQFFATQIINGLALGILGPAWDAIYSTDIEHTKDPQIDTAVKRWTLWTGGVDFSSGVAAIIGGLIIAHFSWTALFIIMAIFDAVSVYFAYRILDPSNEPNSFT